MVHGKLLKLAGKSDASWRERIGNMVPPGAAKAIGQVCSRALLVASEGLTWDMSATEVWVIPRELETTVELDERRS
jgi:hypothetical protein